MIWESNWHEKYKSDRGKRIRQEAIQRSGKKHPGWGSDSVIGLLVTWSFIHFHICDWNLFDDIVTPKPGSP